MNTTYRDKPMLQEGFTINYTKMVSVLQDNEVFVFGSNEAGIHGAGAAKLARINFGAEMGVGVGMTGRCYALPTKDHQINTLPLTKVKQYIEDFIHFTTQQPNLNFVVTEVGCGLAGFKLDQIAPLFFDCMKSIYKKTGHTFKNVFIPIAFMNFYSQNKLVLVSIQYDKHYVRDYTIEGMYVLCESTVTKGSVQ